MNSAIYLSADANETLTTVDRTCTYIIGGIVDRNRNKNATREKAETLGINTCRLPIQENIRLASSCVLSCVNGMKCLLFLVFEILLQYNVDDGWKECIAKSIPIRKIKATTSINSGQN